MPIEDADKVHSRRGGKDEAIITIFGHPISFMKLMIIIGVSVASIFMIIAGILIMFPAPLPPPVVQVTPLIVTDPLITFNVINTNYNYRVIKLTYGGNKAISNLPAEISLSLYPPLSPHYVQRQVIQNDNNILAFNSQYNTIYIYTGIDNAFHMSYTIPKYSDCVDFINGNWNLVIDGKTHNIYKFKFDIDNSNTIIIENGMFINEYIKNTSDYSTFFIYSGIYKEKILLTKPIRLIGVTNPVIDAGGSGAAITIQSNNNVLSGLTIINSGNKEFSDGGIVIMPGSAGNIITKNTIYKTLHGIWLYQSGTNTITNNIIRDNDKNGILLTSSSSNTIITNTIYNNINGIYADLRSDLNTIRENNFYNNKNYGVIIENYPTLNNTCEYNTYRNNTMLCSDSIDRDQIPAINNITVTPVKTISTTDDWWADCKGNPKCYQSK